MASNSSMSADRRLTSLLVVMCTALALVIGATSSLSIALPDLARDLEASQAELTWIVNAYSVVFAAVLLPFGIAADRFGRRLALLLGLTIFGLARCVSALLNDPTLVAALRALAGLGAAGVFPATLSVLQLNPFPPQRRARAVSVWAGVSGGAATIGTLIGGGMLEVAGWAGIQVVFGVLALALLVPVARFVDDSRNPRLSLNPFDGGLLAVIGLGALVFGVIQAGDRSFGDPAALIGVGVGVAGLLGFVAWELRTDTPMLEVRLFRNPGLSAGSLVISLHFFAAFGFFFPRPAVPADRAGVLRDRDGARVPAAHRRCRAGHAVRAPGDGDARGTLGRDARHGARRHGVPRARGRDSRGRLLGAGRRTGCPRRGPLAFRSRPRQDAHRHRPSRRPPHGVIGGQRPHAPRSAALWAARCWARS